MSGIVVDDFSEKEASVAKDFGKHRFCSEEVTRLVKLLDLNDARLLVFAYHNFPDELFEDLDVIRNAMSQRDDPSVSELVQWYERKALLGLAANMTGEKIIGFSPKTELWIFKK